MLEGRAMLMAVKRVAVSPWGRDRRALFLMGNLSVCLSLDRGRTSTSCCSR